MATRRERDRRTRQAPATRTGRRRRRRLGVPASVVFYVLTALATVGAGLVYLRGAAFLVFSISAALLIIAALLINDRDGFYQSRRARRSSEPRDKFTIFEVVFLFALLLLCIFVSVYVWVPG